MNDAHVFLGSVKYFVIDEADQFFIENGDQKIMEIFEHDDLPPVCLTWDIRIRELLWDLSRFSRQKIDEIILANYLGY